MPDTFRLRASASAACDVEGHEAETLEGAARTIERDRPALCEVFPLE
jgi:hypothetical protein